MSETFKCPACGAANNLPEGKTSMACVYCGASIHQPATVNNSIQSKPRLSKIALDEDSSFNRLSYINRNISSLDEVIEVYSDDELLEISELNLSKNKINSLNGLERFRLGRLDLTANQIAIIDSLPEFGRSISIVGPTIYRIDMDFSNNENVIGFTDEVIYKINAYTLVKGFELTLCGCNKFNFIQLAKIDFARIMATDDLAKAVIWVDSFNRLPDVLQKIGFEAIEHPKRNMWCYTRKQGATRQNESVKGTASINSNSNTDSGLEATSKIAGGLSVLNWLYLLAPYGIAILLYSLGKSWEISDTSFFACLGMSCFAMCLFAGVRFSDRTVKTGRSFNSKYGKLEEYTTEQADLNDVSNKFWQILYLHVAVTIISFVIYFSQS